MEGEPADFTTVFLLAKLNGINVKVVDDPNYERTAREKEECVDVIHYQRGEDINSVGHYTLMSTETTEINVFSSPVRTETTGTGRNDCAYEVLGILTGKQACELRQQAAQFICGNANKFAKIQKPADWIRHHFPLQANEILAIGGTTRQEAEGEEEPVVDEEVVIFEEEVAAVGEEVAVAEEEEEELPSRLEATARFAFSCRSEDRFNPDLTTHHITLAENTLLLSAPPDGATSWKPGTRVDPSQEIPRLNRLIEKWYPWKDTKNKPLDVRCRNVETGQEFFVKLGRLVAGHIVNDHLAGRGTDGNLFTQTNSCNQKYHNHFEGPLKSFDEFVRDGQRIGLIPNNTTARLEMTHVFNEHYEFRPPTMTINNLIHPPKGIGFPLYAPHFYASVRLVVDPNEHGRHIMDMRTEFHKNFNFPGRWRRNAAERNRARGNRAMPNRARGNRTMPNRGRVNRAMRNRARGNATQRNSTQPTPAELEYRIDPDVDDVYSFHFVNTRFSDVQPVRAEDITFDRTQPDDDWRPATP